MYKLLDGRDWQWEKLGLALVGRALLGEALTQLSADGWGCTGVCELQSKVNEELLEGLHQGGPSSAPPVVSP